MAIEHTFWASKQSAGDAIAKLTLLMLSDFCEMDGSVQVSADRMAPLIEASSAEVVSAVKRLRERSLLPGAIVVDGEIHAVFPTKESPPPPAERPDQRGHCYVMSDGTSTKIGVSKILTARLRGMQTAVPLDIALCFSIHGPMKVMRRIEKLALASLADHRITGEWVAVHPDVAIAAVCRARDDVENTGGHT